ncbi:[NiFe]-hydrogenase assembly chaperone HybE [Rhodoferax ferrireducens]|uniref:[NiFe]-hydrogenase assembly chaperone HybE n=1 Tax=Rhodoferax ferrireducens TaxID=192843 RepID=UPI000E0D60B6|nr:[NiFe]-hydrogenase assembly chaperone HybE [Rhodoferax ferrireducens]
MHNLTLPSSLAASLRARTEALVELFDNVAQARMAGVPILNPALRVEALGFELCEGDGAEAGGTHGAVGVLVTPWFMNLVWFPLDRIDQPDRAGSSRVHQVGAESFDFIAGHEPAFGSFEACSLFSPMFEFPDQAAASATGAAVLATLRQPPEPAPVPQAKSTDLAARRAFLFGRRPSAGDKA